MNWRWDQGRLDYFQLDEVRRLAKALIDFDGNALARGDEEDGLRVVLKEHSDRPFLPTTYKVWRNYKRVFGCQMLATEINGRLICTDLCKKLASDEIDDDQYIAHIVKGFYFPSPIFEDYKTDGPQIFPMCLVLKLLLAEYLYKNKPFVTIEEIVGTLRNSNLTGSETLETISNVEVIEVDVSDMGDEVRQIREMMRFISQVSFLKWKNPKLLLDIETKEEAFEIEKLLVPSLKKRNSNSSLELLEIGSNVSDKEFNFSKLPDTIFDEEFTEGSKIRVTHVRRERSSKLKEFYFALHHLNPHICNMCSMDTLQKYGWVSRLIELHHLLPLSSNVRVEKDSTSLKDIVGLCPTCHRATHKFYSKWFKEQNQKDFNSKEEAHYVYEQARQKVIL